MQEGKSTGTSYAETYLPLLACGWSEMKSIRTDRWKFILAPKPELYDLARDPLEKDNVIDREAETAGRMLRRLTELEKASRPARDRGTEFALSQEDAEKLSSLGYIGLGTGAEHPPAFRHGPQG